jgi:hypothetical protein
MESSTRETSSALCNPPETHAPAGPQTRLRIT